VKHRPDQVGLSLADMQRLRPWWIRAHRCVAVPFRAVRRRLLTAIGVRAAGGQASSEAFPEIAHRRAA
jgi:DNA-binding IclR family transcriptional regulator